MPAAPPGGVLLRVLYLSLDPYMRGRMDDRKSYAKPVGLGEPMTGETVAEVIASDHRAYAIGDIVLAPTGWRSHCRLGRRRVAQARSGARAGLDRPRRPRHAGVHRLCRPHPHRQAEARRNGVRRRRQRSGRPRSSASSRKWPARGRSASPAARKSAATCWTSSASTPRSTIAAPTCRARLAAACPKGIDVYFENVGGAVWQAVRRLVNPLRPRTGLRADRAVQRCAEETPGALAATMRDVLTKSLTLRGFINTGVRRGALSGVPEDRVGWPGRWPDPLPGGRHRGSGERARGLSRHARRAQFRQGAGPRSHVIRRSMRRLGTPSKHFRMMMKALLSRTTRRPRDADARGCARAGSRPRRSPHRGARLRRQFSRRADHRGQVPAAAAAPVRAGCRGGGRGRRGRRRRRCRARRARMIGWLGYGGMAEKIVVAADRVAPMPDAMDFETAAALHPHLRHVLPCADGSGGAEGGRDPACARRRRGRRPGGNRDRQGRRRDGRGRRLVGGEGGAGRGARRRSRADLPHRPVRPRPAARRSPSSSRTASARPAPT